MLRRKQKHGVVRYVFDWTNIVNGAQSKLPIDVWNTVYQPNNEFIFSLPQKGRKLLREIVGNHVADALYAITDSHIANKQVRIHLSEKLKYGSIEDRTKAALWVVRYWGRIVSGNDAIQGWVEELDDYNDKAVSDFIENWDVERVASWSKMLAFADYQKYAIFDSNTAVALNVGLHLLNKNIRFFMPPPREGEISDAIKAVKNAIDLKKNRHRYRKYLEYLEFLRVIRDTLNAGTPAEEGVDLLSIEMGIFYNADRLAQLYLNETAQGRACV